MDAIGKLRSLCRIIANGCGFSRHYKRGSTLKGLPLMTSLDFFPSQKTCLINQAFVFSSDKYSDKYIESQYGSRCSSVLVIESEPSLQCIYRKLLRQRGYYSVIVNTIAEALAMIDQDFDLVYVDFKCITVQDFLTKARDFATEK